MSNVPLSPGDLVIYHGGKGDPKPVQLLSYLSEKKALVLLNGQERKVQVGSLLPLEEYRALFI